MQSAFNLLAPCRWSSKGAASWPALGTLHLDANLMTGKLRPHYIPMQQASPCKKP